jgi:tetratricopeptide (TPR) repeat protein/predicted Ser/Thr protein kinase
MNGPPGGEPTPPLTDTGPAAEPDEAPRLTQVGRYVLLKQLGEGGMGVVFAAYDPDLDRKVALKLLRPDARTDSEQARARLLREAQAMARVSHPHVIPIFDVGIWGAQVFLAMELIDGGTLSDWLKGSERSWREVLEKFLAAGQGLLAAHEAGLVHRDFKPGNVLVSRNGRVCVTDFGLARQVDKPDAEPAAAEEPRPPEVEHRMLEVNLTETGMVMGTPSYMSPEQFRSTAVDARSDQFSFCVSLYWALYRQRPFDPARLRVALAPGAGDETPGGQPTKVEGTPRRVTSRPAVIQEPPRDSKVPAWIRQAVMRGLSVSPGERFPSMKELLEALSQETRLTRRRRWAGVAAVSAVGLSLVGGAVYQSSQVCAGAGELMEEVWSPEARQKLEASFLATGRPFAGDMVPRVLAVLDGYASAWTQQRTEACEATRLRGVQTEELLSRREVCLERRRRDMRALVDVLQRADGPLVEKSLDAAHALPALHECADVESLDLQQRLPTDPGKRAGIEALVDRVAELKVLVDTARYAVAKEKAGPLGAQVESTGYLPLMAELHTYQGWLKGLLGQSEEASRDLLRAAYEAEAGRADRLKVDILTRLLFLEGEQKRFDTADNWGNLAEATLQRIGGDPMLESVLLVNRGNMAVSRQRLPEAKALFEKAQALQQVLPPGHPKRARVTYQLGNVLLRMGERTRALELLLEALEQTEAAVGRLHPDTARRHTTLAWALREIGNHARALEHARSAVEIRKALFGQEHKQTTGAMAEVGQCLLGLGRYQEALEVYQETLGLQLRTLKPEDEYLQYTYDGVGQALLGLGRAREAIVPLQKAVSYASMSPDVLADSGFALAKALWAEGRPGEARAEASKARERFTQAGLEKRAAEVLAWLDTQAKPRSHEQLQGGF